MRRYGSNLSRTLETRGFSLGYLESPEVLDSLSTPHVGDVSTEVFVS